jgi:hypothetical protein
MLHHEGSRGLDKGNGLNLNSEEGSGHILSKAVEYDMQ